MVLRVLQANSIVRHIVANAPLTKWQSLANNNYRHSKSTLVSCQAQDMLQLIAQGTDLGLWNSLRKHECCLGP